MFVADALTRDKALLNDYHGDEIAAELLGLSDNNALRKLVGNLGTGGDARAQLITLALVLSSLESRTPKDAWRSPSTGWSHFVKGADYLKFLAAQGYRLSAVEEVITGDKTLPVARGRFVGRFHRCGRRVCCGQRSWARTHVAHHGPARCVPRRQLLGS